MKTISSHTFKHVLKDIHKHTENRKFCFVLGAGASYKSGIPTGGQLAKQWFDEIQDRSSKDKNSKKEIENWIKEDKINKKDLASHYGTIYRKRFENDKTSGYEFLVQEMKDATPSFGHIVLAQILSRVPGHCVLTTNFDSLIESAIYQFTNKTPLVCGHESLSGYARPSKIHPLIVKIHRDLLLSPKSDPKEINELDAGWNEPLDNIFSTHIPIVIGYGGNDGSLMTYFEQMKKTSNFFWCGLKESDLSNRTKKLIEKLDGQFVKIKGFDELMHELLLVFNEIKPIKEELNEITRKRIDIADRQLNEILQLRVDNGSENKEEGISKELSALEYSNLADKENDPEKKKEIYLKALDQYPGTAWLWNEFTYFLQYVKKDYSNLDGYYQKALSVDPEDEYNNGNYANYLKNIKKDYGNAEKHYLKALSIDPENATNNGNYANYLKNIKKDYKNAEKYYLKALSIDPENANNIGNYANYLCDIKKDYGNAEKYYLKALSINPEDANNNGNYAIYLKNIKKDYGNAEKYYLKALSIDPEQANNNGNYAQFLLGMNRKNEATKYLEKAFKLNGEEKNGLLLELWFYKYAHNPEFIEEAEKNIEELLSEGIRSIGWDFSDNIKVAIASKHPFPGKLKDFAKRITETDSK